ncbi:MAG: hypothetical protein AB1560_11590 [Pseudomonadota bacterium]
MSEISIVRVLKTKLDFCANTYGVAPCTASGAPGSECYNTFGNCQDKLNYVKTVKVYKFTEIGAPIRPGEFTRPYVTKISKSPTEIDPEAGVARQANCTITLRDATDPDVESDPYVRNRATPAGGTFLSRFKARHTNYQGRPCELETYQIVDGVWGTPTVEHYTFEQLKGPARGEATFVLRDPLSLAMKTKVPTPTTGKLALPLTVNDLQATLGAGEGAQYPASGYFRHNDEVIQYTGKAGDVLSWPDGTYRAKFGTAALAAKVGDSVQLCEILSGSVATVLQRLLNLCGIVDGSIDLAGMQSEDNTWLGAKYTILRCVASPETAYDMMVQICRLTGGVIWWSSLDQKVKYKVIGPQAPSVVIGKTLTDEANLIDGKTQVERLDNLRITMSAVSYDLASAVADPREPNNYRTGAAAIDLDAEGPNENNGRIVETFFGSWFGPANVQAMNSFVQRRISQYRDPPDKISFMLHPKDGAVKEAELYDLETADIVDAAGEVLKSRVLILRRTDRGGEIDIVARTTTFNRRYGFIAPAGTPNYPNNNGYACVADAAGKMSDGTDGYRII